MRQHETPPPVALTPAGAVQTPTDRMLSDVEKDVAQLLQRLANRMVDERPQSAASAPVSLGSPVQMADASTAAQLDRAPCPHWHNSTSFRVYKKAQQRLT